MISSPVLANSPPGIFGGIAPKSVACTGGGGGAGAGVGGGAGVGSRSQAVKRHAKASAYQSLRLEVAEKSDPAVLEHSEGFLRSRVMVSESSVPPGVV